MGLATSADQSEWLWLGSKSLTYRVLFRLGDQAGRCWIKQAGSTQPLTELAPEGAEEVDELEDVDATLGGQRLVSSSRDIEQCHDLRSAALGQLCWHSVFVQFAEGS